MTAITIGRLTAEVPDMEFPHMPMANAGAYSCMGIYKDKTIGVRTYIALLLFSLRETLAGLESRFPTEGSGQVTAMARDSSNRWYRWAREGMGITVAETFVDGQVQTLVDCVADQVPLSRRLMSHPAFACLDLTKELTPARIRELLLQLPEELTSILRDGTFGIVERDPVVNWRPFPPLTLDIVLSRPTLDSLTLAVLMFRELKNQGRHAEAKAASYLIAFAAARMPGARGVFLEVCEWVQKSVLELSLRPGRLLSAPRMKHLILDPREVRKKMRSRN